MHSKRRYKICICSVILGELEASQNYKGFSVIFPKILDAIQRFRACLHGGGVPQIGEVTRLGGVTRLSI